MSTFIFMRQVILSGTQNVPKLWIESTSTNSDRGELTHRSSIRPFIEECRQRSCLDLDALPGPPAPLFRNSAVSKANLRVQVQTRLIRGRIRKRSKDSGFSPKDPGTKSNNDRELLRIQKLLAIRAKVRLKKIKVLGACFAPRLVLKSNSACRAGY